ncbi:hypothetical protein R309_004914 [Salmonella enterica subsp. enterica]|nr:hypothetical protein [Salmonella enterica subsp. enterica serovar Redlands]
MKNSLGDLHNHLFAQLERLSDESVKTGDNAPAAGNKIKQQTWTALT